MALGMKWDNLSFEWTYLWMSLHMQYIFFKFHIISTLTFKDHTSFFFFISTHLLQLSAVETLSVWVQTHSKTSRTTECQDLFMFILGNRPNSIYWGPWDAAENFEKKKLGSGSWFKITWWNWKFDEKICQSLLISFFQSFQPQGSGSLSLEVVVVGSRMIISNRSCCYEMKHYCANAISCFSDFTNCLWQRSHFEHVFP